MELFERVGQVTNRSDLIDFVKALENDLGKNPDAWENKTLERYLSALSSWLEDCDGYYQSQGRPVPENPSWRDIAEMLMAAKIYE